MMAPETKELNFCRAQQVLTVKHQQPNSFYYFVQYATGSTSKGNTLLKIYEEKE